MRSHSTPASSNAFSVFRRMRSPRRDAGFTISSTRLILRGANFIAVAALIAGSELLGRYSFASRGFDDLMDPAAVLLRLQRKEDLMLGAGIEPAWEFVPRDFKSLASTDFATRAENDKPPR